MKKLGFCLFSALMVLSMLLSACAPAATTAPTTAPATAVPATKAPDATQPTATQPAAAATATTGPTVAPAAAGATKITFWHSMGAPGGPAIVKMANDYNSSQQKCHVTPIFQGTYDQSLNKLKAGLQSKDTPAIVQLFDLATRQMIDLQVVTPVQNYIDKEKYDISDLEPNILNYYSVDKKLYSMPFNSSNPLLYYNVDMFKAAGLDPTKPPRTFDEVVAAARKLTKKDANGKVTVSGINIAIYGWFFEQFLAVSGANYVDNGNGRTSFATKAIFNGPEGLAIINWWKSMYDEGILGNTGKATADSRNAFLAGQTAMILESTAQVRALLDGSKDKFELGTGYLPRPNEDAYTKSGTIIGGASLWIINNRPQAEQDCAWEFIKFQSSPAEQAFWHTSTGYIPIRKAAYNEQIDKDWVAKYPQFTTSMNQLHDAPLNTFTQGGLVGTFPQARADVETMIESVLLGKSKAQEALDATAKKVTDAITEYNQTMGLK